MSSPRLEKLIGSPFNFITSLLSEHTLLLPSVKIDIDHICYRVTSYQEYYSLKNELTNIGILLTESEVNGRPISCFKLFNPIQFEFNNQQYTIPLIELPAPKPGSSHKKGFEHIEIALGFEPSTLQNKYPDLKWIKKGLQKIINPEIELEFGKLGSIKYHQQSLEEVIQNETLIQLLDFPFESDTYFAIDKPAGAFTQTPEASKFAISENRLLLPLLENHFTHPVYPVHRLDSATSGLVLFGKNKQSTAKLSQLFKNREISKTYHCIVRGHTKPEGVIDIPLKHPETGIVQDCFTEYRTIKSIELPFAVGKYSTARYSLVEVKPKTGKWHQIRRHFDQISHPLIGDNVHGDSYHNRFFRDQLGLGGLWLRATQLEFISPETATPTIIKAPACYRWQRALKHFE